MFCGARSESTSARPACDGPGCTFECRWDGPKVGALREDPMIHRETQPMSGRSLGRSLAALLVVSIGSLALATGDAETLRFAADMAKRGNWREALYRWNRVTAKRPDDARILNNLAVAHEALGEPETARRYYERALRLSNADERIEANQIRFVRFWSGIAELNDDDDATDQVGSVTDPSASKGKSKGKGKAVRVTVMLPVPPRLDTTGYRTVLVARFLAEASDLVDVPHEMVRFVRSKLRKDRDLEVLDVVPAPEVPEQTLEDLLQNGEFWKYLGREYGADLIVSGVVEYERRDSSGFEDMDRIDPTTGQKVRTSEFVEQERFSYAVDLIIMSGSTGDLVYRDRMQRSSVYRGSNNDPITAFYDLSESLTADVMAIVEPRTLQDQRFIFKK